jgi:hypothetical protein
MASDGGDIKDQFEPLAGMTGYWLVLKTRGPTRVPVNHPS